MKVSIKELIENAHMAGQKDAGVDPGYSNAQAYWCSLGISNFIIEQIKPEETFTINIEDKENKK